MSNLEWGGKIIYLPLNIGFALDHLTIRKFLLELNYTSLVIL